MDKCSVFHPFGLTYSCNVTVIVTMILLACSYCVHCTQKTMMDDRNTSKVAVTVNCTCHEWHSFESAVLELQNETTVAIYSEQIQVRTAVLIRNRNRVNLRGRGEVNTKIICNAINTGFAFEDVSNLQISNIDFVECSLNFINRSISGRHLIIVAAIFIVNSTNLISLLMRLELAKV